tara:strand:- start:34400 stop:35251 length:852 start_codon:yes stop_codon:yes gene_type:complete
METTSESPLKKYKRKPKVFIDLPSQGKYSSTGTLNNDVYTQLAVYSMTAADEILFKTPDALINGEATARCIQSCIPSIQNPWNIPTLDIDTILIAIRMATYGPTMTVSSKCPHCKTTHTYDIELSELLEFYQKCEYTDKLVVDDFLIKLKPVDYQQLTENQKTAVALQRAMDVQVRALEDNEEEKAKYVDSLLTQIAEHAIKIIFDNVESVTVDGETETRREEIVEFMSGADVHIFQKVKDHIETQSKIWRTPSQTVVCGNDECKKEHKILVSLDQSDFFAKG